MCLYDLTMHLIDCIDYKDGVCVSVPHLTGLQHIDLFFIYCVLVLLQETFTLVLYLLNNKTGQLVLQLEGILLTFPSADKPLTCAKQNVFSPSL